MVDAQPNAFEQKIEDMIAQLASKSAARRREAALFLGEAAAADAVPALVEVYQKDKNAQVRAAAAYSLGMYKAVENALKAGEETEVVLLLRQIEEQGELGTRAPVGRRFKTLLALLISLLALLVLYFVRDDVKGLLYGSTKPRAEVVAGVRQSFGLIKDDTRTLQSILLDVISNKPLSCIAYFNNPGPYALDRVDARTFPDIGSIVDKLNAAQVSLANAKTRYDEACATDIAAFGASEAQQTFQLLLPALQALDPLELELTQASAAEASAALPLPTSAAATAIPATAAPTAELPTVAPTSAQAAIATAEATAAEEPTEQADPKTHLRMLFNLVDAVTEPRGAATLLVQYWTNVQNGAQTQVCTVSQIPDIPSLDALGISDAELAASADLATAVEMIRAALDTVSTGWTDLQFACNAQTLSAKVAEELPQATLAVQQFAAARVKLEAVQNAP